MNRNLIVEMRAQPRHMAEDDGRASRMKIPAHLVTFENQLTAGGEWRFEATHWTALQLVAGIAYVRAQGTVAEIGLNELLVIPPGSAISVVSSTLEKARLRGVGIRPDALSGVVTLSERQAMESSAVKGCHPFRALPAISAFAQKVQQVWKAENGMTLGGRLEFLAGFAELLAPYLNGADEPAATSTVDAKLRLKQLMNTMPESELVELDLGALSKLMNCCERHVRRLFKETFGRTFRDHLAELRLKKACRLLVEGNRKIIDVAYESGHGSLAIFNYVFKRRFKVTPSGWREKYLVARQRPARTRLTRRGSVMAFVAAIFFFAVTSFAANAQQGTGEAAGASTPTTETRPVEPDATTPAPSAKVEPADASPKFKVVGYNIVGNTLLSQPRLETLLAPFTGETIDMLTLSNALATLQLEYRSRGFFTVRVGLPPQQVTNGYFRVDVTEGVLRETTVLNNRYFSKENVLRSIPSAQSPWDDYVLNGKLLQAEVDRANANSDRQVFPELRPGPEPGTSALALYVKDRLPLHGRVEWNNQHTPNTPNERVSANIAYNNLWQLEHSLGLQYGFSPQQSKGDVPDLDLNEILDAPLVAYYSAFYRLPLGVPVAVEKLVASDTARFGYNEASRQFVLPPSAAQADLVAYVSRSTSDVLQYGQIYGVVTNPLLRIERQEATRSPSADVTAGFRFNVPLPERARIRSSFSLGLDFKQHEGVTLASNIFYTTISITNSSGQVEERRDTVSVLAGKQNQAITYAPLFLGWNGSRPDKSGQFTAGLSLTYSPGGQLASVEEFPGWVGSADADGEFLVLRPRISREQRVLGTWTLAGSVEGQWSTVPLGSLEQFGLGGVSTVRGYLEGEQYGDSGWLAKIELRSRPLGFGNVFKNTPLSMVTVLFADYGQSFYAEPQGRDASTELYSVGGGFNFNLGSYGDCRLIGGVPLADGPYSRYGEWRLLFSLGAQF